MFCFCYFVNKFILFYTFLYFFRKLCAHVFEIQNLNFFFEIKIPQKNVFFSFYFPIVTIIIFYILQLM